MAHRKLVLSVLGGLLLACLLYCLVVPNEYEARARIALRTAPATSLNIEGQEPAISASVLSAPMQLETVAGVLGSERLAWKVILGRKLYLAPAFNGRFSARFQGFQPDAPAPDAQSYLLDRFQKRLHVGTLPHSLLVEVRFTTRDPGLSAEVVNALIDAYTAQQTGMRAEATGEASLRLRGQLEELKKRVDEDDRRLAAFQRKHGILISPATLPNDRPGATEHLPALMAADELGKELAAAGSERILREAEYRAAVEGDPEVVLAFDPRAENSGAGLAGAYRQIHAKHGDLEQELAQLSIERGPNFPRVQEIRQQLSDLDRQLETENATARKQFRDAWSAAENHERMLRAGLRTRTGEGLKENAAATTFEAMRLEADSTRELYLRMQAKVEEAGLAGGAHGADIWVVDEARIPAKPSTPNLPVYMAITLVAGLWIAIGCAVLVESVRPSAWAVLLIFGGVLLAGNSARAQAPTPSTSGLPTGVARIPASRDNKGIPNPAADEKNAAPASLDASGVPAGNPSTAPLAAPIAPGDLLDISEFHTPEFHTTARVSAAGTVKLPLLDEVRVEGMDEMAAAHAIASALMTRGILNHPQVSVLVTAWVGQDVTVLGEVTRPGVYPYTLHHRLFDLISAASGLSPAAGGVVNIYHRGEPNTPHPVALQANGLAKSAGREDLPDCNPELAPGDTLQITRAGLVYVVGDVIRPGGFTVDPTQEFTVLKALSLAWGPSQNASLGKALLIREQNDGRTVTALNLKRMLRGQDPDQPLADHDILFVPDSAAKNLFNRTIESAIQSAAGVSIYAGMVYSQRF